MSAISYEHLDASKISLTQPIDNIYIRSQMISFIKYNNTHLNLQSPYMHQSLSNNKGYNLNIPNSCKYYPDEKSRAFLKVSFNDSNDNFKNALLLVDEHIKSLDGYILPNKNKYSYTPIIRQSDEDNKPPYIKLKIELDNMNKPILSVFDNIEGTRKLININSLDDLSYLMRNSKIRVIINFNKLYIMKNSFNNSKKNYGVVLKLTHLEVIRNAPLNEISFLSSEESEYND